MTLPVWAAVILFALRAQLRGEPRWWLVLLLVSLAIALLWLGPRPALRLRWLWAGVGLAVLVGSPSLIYQVAHGFPQLDMAVALAENMGGETRLQLLPFQLLLLGPPVTAIWMAGLVALFRGPAWRPARALAGAYTVLLVIVLISGGQVYYPVGLLDAVTGVSLDPSPAPGRAQVIIDQPQRSRKLASHSRERLRVPHPDTRVPRREYLWSDIPINLVD